MHHPSGKQIFMILNTPLVSLEQNSEQILQQFQFVWFVTLLSLDLAEDILMTLSTTREYP